MKKISTLSIIFIIIIIILILIITYCILTLCMCSYDNEKLKNIELENLPLIKEINQENNISIIILGTDMKKELYNNISSLKQYGYYYKVIGFGDKFGGWNWRMLQYINYIKIHKEIYGEESIMVFIDGYDAFACKNSEGLYEKFIKQTNGNKILSGLDNGLLSSPMCGNIYKWWEYKKLNPNNYYKSKCNMGFCMGRAKDLEELYKWIYDNKYEDDQIGLLNFSEIFPEKIEYDIDEIIINNTLPIDKIYTPKYEPYFRHYPGYSQFQFYTYISFNYYSKKYINDHYDFSKLIINKTKYNITIFSLSFSTFLAITFGFFLASELNNF